jgi:hypothetical protein
MRLVGELVRAALLVFLVACGGGDADGGDGDAGPAIDSGGSDPQGPRIAELTVDRPSLSEGEVVTFTAVVTDPDGAEDIAGGTLALRQPATNLGAFVLVSGSTYTASLAWDQLHAAAAIEFTDNDVRAIRVEFVDQAGHEGWQEFPLPLACPARAACAGVCTDLTSDPDHCGSCDMQCAPEQGDFGGCAESACRPGLSACFQPGDVASCDAVCASEGSTCVEGGCDGATVIYFSGPTECAQVVQTMPDTTACDAELLPTSEARCCCAP